MSSRKQFKHARLSLQWLFVWTTGSKKVFLLRVTFAKKERVNWTIFAESLPEIYDILH